ncbi:MAG: putative Ig domain-containing protein [Fibrobacterota bacterium]
MQGKIALCKILAVFLFVFVCHPVFGLEVNVQVVHADSTYNIVGSSSLTNFINGIYSDMTARPPLNDYHDVLDWRFNRHYWIIDDILSHTKQRRDWSAYPFLRVDAYAANAAAVIGIRVKDASGPMPNSGYRGIHTPFAIFNIPQGQWVTCNFPLAEMASENELDLTHMAGFYLRLNGYAGDTPLQLKNIRLVGSGTSDYPLLEMSNAVEPFKRKVSKGDDGLITLAERDRVKLVKDLSPVSALGPVTVVNTTGRYYCGSGHFGASGDVYLTCLQRGVVAYDNGRLLVLMGASATGMLESRAQAQGGTECCIMAMGSFDGGATWGGITRGETRPLHLSNWFDRASASSDCNTGDVYYIGTQNCSSYHGVTDILFRRLALTGDAWVEDRVSPIEQMFKCPGWTRVVRLPSGRLWATPREGFDDESYCMIKYSDDDGFTWMPCKDASLPAPRPLYRPGIDPVPDQILQLPGHSGPGPFLVPYKNGVASFSLRGNLWAMHDGNAWGSVQTLGYWGSGEDRWTRPYSSISETVINDNHIFMAKGGYHYGSNLGTATDLVVNNYKDGGTWQKDTLEAGGVTESILTSSGNCVFCFYVIGNQTVKYRRWKEGVWGAAVTVATETDTINRLAAPQQCPPSYACVLWDRYIAYPTVAATWVKFARVPTDNGLLIASASLPKGCKDSVYTCNIQAACGVEPYSFAKTSGTLPSGLTLNSNGTLSGTPGDTGTFSFTVQVTDNNADTASRTLTLQVGYPLTLAVKLQAPSGAMRVALNNQPNPFGSHTVINYRLAVRDRVTIQVYDIRGKQIACLVDQVKDAGTHSIHWRAQKLATGIYFTQLSTGRHKIVQKLIHF